MKTFEIEQGIEVLERTPNTLKVMLSGLSNEWIDKNEGPETWSPFDIVGHLIHGEKTDWITRARIILNKGPNKEFEPFDRFAQFENSRGKSISDLLEEFAELRTRNLQQLEMMKISDKDMDLKGIHPEFGEVTMRQLLSTWVVHDLGHISQIARVMAKQYKIEIGPWSRYLSIVN
jgi:hypothetical protein